jgi:t-SNARE complex subunit (syntaxin)
MSKVSNSERLIGLLIMVVVFIFIVYVVAEAFPGGLEWGDWSSLLPKVIGS